MTQSDPMDLNDTSTGLPDLEATALVSVDTRGAVVLESGSGWNITIRRDQLPITIGRSSVNMVSVKDRTVSRQHCVLEFDPAGLRLRDISTNGTVVSNRLLRHAETKIVERTCLVFGQVMMWVTPLDDEGQVRTAVPAEDESADFDTHHGVCMVDICDSTEAPMDQVGAMVQRLRQLLVRYQPHDLLMLKHTGDGYIAIYRDPKTAIKASEKLLRWRKRPGSRDKLDIRVTIDMGPTFPSSDGDRMGLVINRAARLEKTQRGHIEQPGSNLDQMRARNRILLTTFVWRLLNQERRDRCAYLGRRRLKGFGDQLFSVYQYEPDFADSAADSDASLDPMDL